MWLFSVALLFSTYYINLIFNDSVLTQSATYSSLNTLMGTFSYNQKPNANLVFGDFVSAFTVIGGLVTGSTFTTSLTVIQNAGFADLSVGLLMGLMFDSGTLFLILYIISFRSI